MVVVEVGGEAAGEEEREEEGEEEEEEEAAAAHRIEEAEGLENSATTTLELVTIFSLHSYTHSYILHTYHTCQPTPWSVLWCHFKFGNSRKHSKVLPCFGAKHGGNMKMKMGFDGNQSSENWIFCCIKKSVAAYTPLIFVEGEYHLYEFSLAPYCNCLLSFQEADFSPQRAKRISHSVCIVPTTSHINAWKWKRPLLVSKVELCC